MDPLTAYIDGWSHHDIPAVLATLDENCVVIECYGPIYRGPRRVKQWMETWLAAGGAVIDWQITTNRAIRGVSIAEWTFTCRWQQETSTFSGGCR